MKYLDNKHALMRREFLMGMLGTVFLQGCNNESRDFSETQLISTDNVGIQLYTVRDRMAVDFRKTLHQIAEIGYKEVEFAGYFENSPKEVYGILSEEGLLSPSTHIPVEFIENAPSKVIDTALTIGHEYIVMAWIEPQNRTLEKYKEYIELFNLFGDQCKKAGIKFAYHNHDFEFEIIDGVRPMDLLLDTTDKDLVSFELDLYWITKGGGDPIEYIKKYPKRFPLWHIKDMASDTSMTDVGEGIINFEQIFEYKDLSGLEHYFIERDDPSDSLVTAKKSFDAIIKLDI